MDLLRQLTWPEEFGVFKGAESVVPYESSGFSVPSFVHETARM